MRVGIQTLGTRGDVQPYLALARELLGRGYAVQLSGPEQFAGFAADMGVPYFSLPGEFLALLDTPEGKAAVAGGQGFSAGFKLLKHVRPLMGRLLERQWEAERSFGPDLIVYHPKAFAAPSIGERLRVPVILASPLPGFTPTRAFPSPMLPFADLGPLNSASHLLAMHGATMLFGKQLKTWRSETLGLTERGAPPPVGTLYAYSPSVLPKPADWGERVLVTGYWFLDEDDDWAMPATLRTFIEGGDVPIYVGFGSMPGVDPRRLGDMVVEALTLAGRRGLLALGGGAMALGDVPDHVFAIEAAPHAHLFRLVDAALHHGGAGTTGASLRAGLPTITCPFLGDQPFWGRIIARSGAGPAPLDRRSLDPAMLAAAFEAAADTATRRRAGELGNAISRERGTQLAADFIERRLT